MSDEIKDVLYNIYECFLLRDLVYVFGGSMVLACTYYAFNGDLVSAIDYVTQNFFKFVIFLTVAYFLGLIVNDGATKLSIKGKSLVEPATLDFSNFNFIQTMTEIRKNWGVDAVRRIERCIYFRNVGAVIGSASLYSALVFLIPLIKDVVFINVFIFCVLVVITIISVNENKKITEGIKTDLKYYAEILDEKAETA